MKNPYSDPHWNDDGLISGLEGQIFQEGAESVVTKLVQLGYAKAAHQIKMWIENKEEE